MKEFLKNNWNNLLTFLIAVFAVIISVKSCSLSQESLNTSINAIEVSKKQFIQINKPFISLKPTKNSNERYFEIVQKEKIVALKIKFEIKNLGNVAATNIHPPSNITVPKKMFDPEGYQLDFNLPPNTVLGPSESAFVYMEIETGHKTVDDAEQYVSDLLDENKDGVTILFPVNYQSEIDQNIKYRLIEEYRIKDATAILLRSELKVFPPDKDN